MDEGENIMMLEYGFRPKKGSLKSDTISMLDRMVYLLRNDSVQAWSGWQSLATCMYSGTRVKTHTDLCPAEATNNDKENGFCFYCEVKVKMCGWECGLKKCQSDTLDAVVLAPNQQASLPLLVPKLNSTTNNQQLITSRSFIELFFIPGASSSSGLLIMISL